MFLKAVVVVLLASIIVPILKAIWGMGWGLHFHTHHPGECRNIKGTQNGSEDLQILTSGQVFLTSGLMVPTSPSLNSKPVGKIQSLDMNAPDPKANGLYIHHDKNFDLETFHPHGLSVLEDEVNGQHLLYVINHVVGQADRIEKFLYSPHSKGLHHLKSIFSDLLYTTNDLYVVAEDVFYITNYQYLPIHSRWRKLEWIFPFPMGGVLFHNGTDFTNVVNGLYSPNGIVVSRDQRFVYVSMSFHHIVNVYKRESGHDLRLIQEAKVYTFLDNLHLSENGDSLFGGCHPVMNKFVSHLGDHSYKSPSQILRLPLKDGLIVEDEITEEFVDQGGLISGSSVAGVYKNRMLIGSIAHSLALCEYPPINN